MLGIGIDTGGTCTDAVVYDLDTKEILSAGKALTTKSHLETFWLCLPHWQPMPVWKTRERAPGF